MRELCHFIYLGMGSWTICLWICSCCLFLECIILGSVFVSSYLEDQKIRYNHVNTCCLLHNYTVLETTCEACNNYGCFHYKCFDEQFLLSYPILNGSYITSTYQSFGKDKTHKQIQVQTNYYCVTILFLFVFF